MNREDLVADVKKRISRAKTATENLLEATIRLEEFDRINNYSGYDQEDEE